MLGSGSGIMSRGARRRSAPTRCAEAAAPLLPSVYFRRKAILDRVLAALLLVPGLPIIGFLVLLVRLTSRGPGVYRQARVGQNGRKFTIYKIRTMRHDAEAASGPVWTQARDPRVTPVGRVLRKFHLDELPQLLNILKGEMSLVGPRPERPEFVHVLAEAVPGYTSRLAVPPGVTGLAQLNLPPDTDLISVQRKLILDREYVERAGLLLDTRIFCCTCLRIVKVPERWVLPVFCLRRSVTIPAGSEAVLSNCGNGSDHTAATPVSLLVDAAKPPIESHGNPAGHDKAPGKTLRDGDRRRKPK
jgi:lipopolysaccharide/colanic/teichoic acid biosynthesis glycosyltransferase